MLDPQEEVLQEQVRGDELEIRAEQRLIVPVSLTVHKEALGAEDQRVLFADVVVGYLCMCQVPA